MPDDLRSAALRYALNLPNVSVVVVGIHDEAELKQDLAWLKEHKPLSADELKKLTPTTKELASKWGSLYGAVV